MRVCLLYMLIFDLAVQIGRAADTDAPTATPSAQPSLEPSPVPSLVPTATPSTAAPSASPTSAPTAEPTTASPSAEPTAEPSVPPSPLPSGQPSAPPSGRPSGSPTYQPTSPTGVPSTWPSGIPSAAPTQPSSQPSGGPTIIPSGEPTKNPSGCPTSAPTQPTGQPTTEPTRRPQGCPTSVPSCYPTGLPSALPTSIPTQPTSIPSTTPTGVPTEQPSASPTGRPLAVPSGVPSGIPTEMPSGMPTSPPSANPSGQPSNLPSGVPTVIPTDSPSGVPTSIPRASPTGQPSLLPSGAPTGVPTTRSAVRLLFCGECQLSDEKELDACGFFSKFVEIRADTIFIEASSSIAVEGTISSSGRGPLSGPGATGSWFLQGSGGSYGGSGGASQSSIASRRLQVTNGLHYSLSPIQIGHTRPDYDFGLIGTASDPTCGSGGGLEGAGRGGGRIILSAVQVNLSLGGALLADGSDSVNANGGGGSGGSVSIYCDLMEGSGTISVAGGHGFENTSTGGGSGGRVYIEARETESISTILITQGGSNSYWTSGAPGTVYTVLKGLVGEAESLLTGITVDGFQSQVGAIVLLNDTEVYPHLMQVVVRNKVTVVGSRLVLQFRASCKGASYSSMYNPVLCSQVMVSDAELIGELPLVGVEAVTSTIRVQGDVVIFSGTSLVWSADMVSINGLLVHIGNTSSIQYSLQAVIHSFKSLILWGSITQTDSAVDTCWDGTVLADVSCDEVGSLTATWQGANALSGIMAIRSNGTIYLGINATLQGPSAVICSSSMTAEEGALISVDGRGCFPNGGIGAGGTQCASPSQCGGGGGGFYGNGGGGDYGAEGGVSYGPYISGAGQNQVLYVGSGGGCSTCVVDDGIAEGSGGGIVIIVGNHSVEMNGRVSARGSSVVDVFSKGLGGGSGGSILIYSAKLIGTGAFYVVGGDGGVSGGGGSGGQILYDRLVDMYGVVDTSSSSQFKGQFFASGGKAGSGSTTEPGDGGILVAPNCPPGDGNFFDEDTNMLDSCILCPLGTYKALPDNSFCLPCNEKPDYSYYTKTGETAADCEFLCNDGLTFAFDECLTFFEIFVEGLGGQAVFSAISVSALLLIFSPVLVYRNLKKYGYFKKRRRFRAVKDTANSKVSFDWFTGNKAIADTGLFLTTVDDEKLMLDQNKEQSDLNEKSDDASPAVMVSPLHRATTQLEEDNDDKFRAMRIETSLTDKDRPKHVGRVYFAGSNSPALLGSGGSWIWPQVCPCELRPMINEPEYAELACAVNQSVRWVTLSFECLCLALMYVFIPAHAPHFLRIRRKVRAQTLLDFIERYNYSCFKSKRQRRQKNSLRVSISMDMTLVYVDFLCDESVVEQAFRPLVTPGQPKLPLAVRFAGTGTYFTPWHIDTNDVLIQAIPQCPILDTFIDSHWISCVAELNNILRTVSRYSLQTGFTHFMKRLGDTWTMKPLGGLVVEFCVFWNFKPIVLQKVASQRMSSTRTKPVLLDLEVGAGGLSSESTEAPSPVQGFDNSRVVSKDGGASSTSIKDCIGALDPTPGIRVSSLEIDPASYANMDYFKTSKDFGKMCELLFKGDLLPGIVIYHPSMLHSKGKWDKKVVASVHEERVVPAAAVLETTAPEWDQQGTYEAPESRVSAMPPGSPAPASAQKHYGARAPDMEKFYDIVRATDSKVCETASPLRASISYADAAATTDVDASKSHLDRALTGSAVSVGDEPEWRRSVGSDASDSFDALDRDQKWPRDHTQASDHVKGRLISGETSADVEYSSFPVPKAPATKRRTFLGALPLRKAAQSEEDLAETNNAAERDAVINRDASSNKVLQSLSSFGDFVKDRFGAEAGREGDIDSSDGRGTVAVEQLTKAQSKINVASAEIFEISPPAMWRWDKMKGDICNVYELCSAHHAFSQEKAESSSSSAFRVTMSSADGEMFRYSDEVDEGEKGVVERLYIEEYLMAIFHLVTSLLTMVFFGRNTYPHGKKIRFLRKLLEVLLSICCIFDFICLSFFTVLYYCIWGNSSECDDQTGFYIIVSVWPGALLVTPLAGFMAIGLGKGGTFPRIYSVWSRLASISLINLIWIYFYRQENAPSYAVFLLMGMIISRVIQSSTIDVYISYRESRRKTRGWDGLSTSLAIVQDNGGYFEADE